MGCISLKFGLVPNNSTNEHQRVGRVVERRKSAKEIVGQEKRVKSEGKKNDFGFVFEFWLKKLCMLFFFFNYLEHDVCLG